MPKNRQSLSFGQSFGIAWKSVNLIANVFQSVEADSYIYV